MRLLLAVVLAVASASCGRGTPKPSPEPAPSAPAEASFADRFPEFAQLPSQVMISGEHYPSYIKGKLLFIYSLEPGAFQQHVPKAGGYPALQDRWARTPEEVSTVLVVDCTSLIQVEDFVLSGPEQRRLPAFDRVCEEAVVDRTLPAIIWRRTSRLPASQVRSVRQGAERVVAEYSPAQSLGQIADKVAEKRIELRD